MSGNDNTGSVTESAKAVQAVAPAINTTAQTLNDVARSFGRIIGPFVEDGAGLLQDKLSYYRASRAVALHQKLSKLVEQRNLEDQWRPVQPKIMIRAVEAGTAEDDDYLQELWAHLITNAIDPQAADVKPAYISILRDFTPLDAQILKTLIEAHRRDRETALIYGIATVDLPNSATADRSDAGTEPEAPPREDVVQALWDLQRLGCLTSAMMFGGASSINRVFVTPLAEGLYDSIYS